MDVDVAVIGGGLAGLAAARELKAAGRSPVVFEATDRVGGRQRSTMLGGQILEEGAVFFGSNYPTLTSVLAETGLEDELKLYEPRSMNRFPVGVDVGRAAGDFIGHPRLPVVEKAKLALFGVTSLPPLVAARNSLGGVVPNRLARHLDTVSAEAYLSRNVGPRFVEWVASPFMEALGFEPASGWSALGALQILAFGGMAKLYGLEGGNSRCAEALAADLDVHFRTRIVELEASRTGVRLQLDSPDASGPVQCRDAVLAIPAPVAAGLLHGALAELVGRFRYSSSLVPAVTITRLDTPLPAVSIFGGPDGYRKVSGMVAEQEHAGDPVRSYGAIRYPWQYELFDAPDSEVLAVLTDVLDEINGKAVEVVDSKVVRWRHSVPVPTPGSIARRREVLDLADDLPHVALAGDWLVSPSQEGALVSGLNAARTLVG